MASLLSIGSAGLSVGGARPAAAQTSRRCVPNVRMSADEFTVAVLGDLHLDPRKMEDYGTGRGHVLPILEDAKAKGQSPVLCSLGDLGESKSVRPEETQELFAGTTACHELAAEFLGSFDVPYEVIGGNHDLEGIDEFATDEANLEAMLKAHNKPTMQFKREVAEKTLLVGLGSTVFRGAKYTSHEVTIDDEQLAWFEEVVSTHPAADGWKIFVFTHAPPIGSGLRVLQARAILLRNSGRNSAAQFSDAFTPSSCCRRTTSSTAAAGSTTRAA